MRILAICGSPRKGNTEFMLKTLLKSAEAKGADTELLLLRNKNIEFCDGCLTCDETGKCHIKDDMQEIYPRLLEADMIVLGTPTYWANVSGLIKVFMDRTNPLWGKLKGKSAGIIAVGEESAEEAIDNLKAFCLDHKMNVKGYIWALARDPKEIAQNKKVIKELKDFGEKLLE